MDEMPQLPDNLRHPHNKHCEVDFHMHSSMSDGGLSPSEVMQHAAEYGACVVSLTDHNTTDGLQEAREEAETLGLEFVNGLEMDTLYKGLDWHVIGYGFDPANERLRDRLRKIQNERREAAREMTEKMQHLGFRLRFEEVEATGSRSLSNYHIVKVMMRRKSNRDRVFAEIHPYPDIFEIIEMYMGAGKEAYVPKQHMEIEEIVDLIHGAGGVAVVAHPGTHHDEADPNYPIDEVVGELVGFGVDGIEAISPKHNLAEIEHFTGLAQRLGVIATAGSDFHGVVIPGVRQERYRRMPYRTYVDMKALLARRGRPIDRASESDVVGDDNPSDTSS